MRRKYIKPLHLSPQLIVALLAVTAVGIGSFLGYVYTNKRVTTSSQPYITLAAVSPEIAVPNQTVAEKINLQRKIITPSNAANMQAAIALVKQHGGSVISQSKDSLVVEFPKETSQKIEEQLSQKKMVDSIEVDYPIYIAADSPDWGVIRIEAPSVWETTAGDGIRVGVVDTGIDYTHPELRSRFAGGYDSVNNDSDPFDDHGHGTHVAGIIASEINSSGIAGVAPRARLYGLKALAKDGTGYTSDLIEAIDWAINNNIQILNFSLGTTFDNSLMRSKIKDAASRGIIITASAGNTNGGPLMYPAAYGEVIAVSATDTADGFASFSSLGAEVAAPGVAIRSTIPGGGYATWSGTSMAAPHVTATIALMMANGQTNVRQQLRDTAIDLGPAGMDNFFGYGLVNAKTAALGMDVLAPVVTIVSPAHNSTVSGTVAVTLDIQDESQVPSIELYVNDQEISRWTSAGKYTYNWDTTGLRAQNYTIRVVATDEYANRGEAFVSVAVSTASISTPSPTLSPTASPSGMPLKEQGKSSERRNDLRGKKASAETESLPSSTPLAQEVVLPPTSEPVQPAEGSNSQQRNPTPETMQQKDESSQSQSVDMNSSGKAGNGNGRGLGKVKGIQTQRGWISLILDWLFQSK